MLIAKRLRMTAVRVFVFAVLTLEWKAVSLGDSRLRRNVGKPVEPVPVNAEPGKPAKMVYRPTNNVLAMNAGKFGQWTKNNSSVVQTDNFVIGGNKEKKRFWLKIKSVRVRDSGLYSFRVNDTVVEQFLLQVKEMSCGGPLKPIASVCVKFTKISYPNCHSFPGPPLNVNVSSHLHEGKPIVQVMWKPPNNGFSDLWGYQVYIAGKGGHPGHYTCHQINRKNERLHWAFKDVKYGATYQITVHSMPAHYHSADKNEVVRDVKVPEKCQFPEYTNSSQCCSLINITAEYNDKQIHLKWVMPLQDQCKEIKAFMIEWNNIQKPEECNGQKLIEGKYEHVISLEKDECTRFNYSIKLRGKTNKTETKVFRVTVLIPQPTVPPPNPAEPPDNSKKIMMAAFGAVLGFLIFGLLVMYRIFFRQVVIDLPDPSSPRPLSNDPLLVSGKKPVFIMHTRCCEKCSYVVHCFGALLNSTELIEASIDMWSTLDIAPNVPRWYEDQVKNSHCVVVLASNKMSLRCQNRLEEGDDPLNISCQLNLVRGKVTQNPDVHRFIPAFFTFSGSKKNVPEFLSCRLSHKLPKEVDRIIFHLLNVEKIQPYRTQPIIVMGGNGHPFDEKKKELELAVQDAELYHKKNNNVQNA